MHRLILLALVAAAATAVGPAFAASPSQEMSRYERDVHEAQKRLHKHRMEKAKKLLNRQRVKAKQLIRQQREQRQRSAGT